MSVALAVVIAAGLALQLGPAFLRTGARRLLAPWQDPAAAPVYAIALEPQSLIVARGSDVQLAATLAGFDSEVVDLLVRRGTGSEWERIPMGAGASKGSFVIRLFDVSDDAEFYVEAGGVRSVTGTLTVKDLPGWIASASSCGFRATWGWHRSRRTTVATSPRPVAPRPCCVCMQHDRCRAEDWCSMAGKPCR
ncbi:MAG: hypothetical protein U5K74_05555 [Gemmatimonadaceae bacterium]|nr:hypothetical protein [Gemmatimonadaceae bacterium]